MCGPPVIDLVFWGCYLSSFTSGWYIGSGRSFPFYASFSGMTPLLLVICASPKFGPCLKMASDVQAWAWSPRLALQSPAQDLSPIIFNISTNCKHSPSFHLILPTGSFISISFHLPLLTCQCRSDSILSQVSIKTVDVLDMPHNIAQSLYFI